MALDQLLQRVAPKRMARFTELETALQESQAEAQVLRSSLVTFSEAIQENLPSFSSPERTMSLLSEQGYDSGMIQLLVDQIGWERVSSLASTEDSTSQERQTMVKQAERLFRYSPLAQFSIWLWTGWGLGDKVTVTLKDDTAQETWDEFATAERNEPVLREDTIHELSDWLLVKGNRLAALFTSTVGDNAGKSTLRILDQDEITLVANPEDKLDIWFYKRTTTTSGGMDGAIYYPDLKTLLGQGKLVDKRWGILQEKKVVTRTAQRADLMQNGTVVSILHIVHNRKDEMSPWGWPITTAAGPWVRGHKQFSEARLGVAMAIAQFVRRSQVKGGSRAVGSVLGQIQSTLSAGNFLDQNPPGAAGSWHVENEASKTKELPMRTGASDAKADNEMFSWMALLGMGLFPTSAGLDTSRWATAVEMDKAQSMIFERYQRFWSSQFRSLVRAVLMLADKYDDSITLESEDTKAEISTDSFSLSDYPDVSKAVADQVAKMLTPYVTNGIIPADTAKKLLAMLWSKSLDALGTGIGRDLTTPEAFGVGDDETGADTSDNAAGDDDDDTEPGMESAFIPILQTALENLDAGEITADQFAEYALAGIADVYLDQSNGDEGH